MDKVVFFGGQFLPNYQIVGISCKDVIHRYREFVSFFYAGIRTLTPRQLMQLLHRATVILRPVKVLWLPIKKSKSSQECVTTSVRDGKSAIRKPIKKNVLIPFPNIAPEIRIK